MSLNLTLIVDHHFVPHFIADVNQVTLDQHYELFARISSYAAPWYGYPIESCCRPRPLDRPLQRKGVSKLTYTDHFGEPLTWLSAGELAQIPWELVAMTGEWNATIFAMVRVMPPETRIILDWH